MLCYYWVIFFENIVGKSVLSAVELDPYNNASTNQITEELLTPTEPPQTTEPTNGNQQGMMPFPPLWW